MSPSDIKAWMDIHDYTDVEDRVDLYELLMAMDLVWLKFAREKIDDRRRKRRGNNADAKGRD